MFKSTKKEHIEEEIQFNNKIDRMISHSSSKMVKKARIEIAYRNQKLQEERELEKQYDN